MRTQPDYRLESTLHNRGFKVIAGVDEAGRGPLAGPVVAAAVVLANNNIPEGINDSKRMTARNRSQLAEKLRTTCLTSVAMADVEEIETQNILFASMAAMRKAIRGLNLAPDYILIDGNRIPSDLPVLATAVVKGDSKSLSIAAASIVAKVERDRIMARLSEQFPEYGWDQNAGYATPMHLAALREFGPTPHHRRGFAPVRDAVDLRIM